MTDEVTEYTPLIPSTTAEEFLEDVESKYEESARNLRKRLWIFVILGLTALLTLHLTFLPRTSLSRDFRRYHGIHLTKTDVKRDFLLYSGIGNSTNSYDTEANIKYWMGNLTALNQHQESNLGPNDELVKYLETQFRKLGLEVKEYPYNKPTRMVTRSEIQLLDGNEVTFKSDLLEPGYSTPAFNVNSRSGDVTAPFIYANEGTYEDYKRLKDNGKDVRDKIVIFRSTLDSNITVGEKVLIAQSMGACATLNYFDIPADKGDREKAISRHTLSNQTSIISVPASMEVVSTVLKKGGKLRIIVESKEISSGVNLVGTVKGIMSEGDIVIGARRDSFGSADPLSGHAILLEVMRHFQVLIKLGWKPLRTIRIVSWDGSHLGHEGSRDLAMQTTLLGMTWSSAILAYINIDDAGVTGSRFHVDSNAVFNHVLRGTAKYVPIPSRDASHEDGYTTLYRYWKDQDGATINNVLGQQIAHTDAYVFENHLNVPTVNVRFDTGPNDDVYVPNSNFYSLDWVSKIDKDLLNHGSLLRFLGMLVISLSEHEVVDYNRLDQHLQYEEYFDRFRKTHKKTLDSWAHKEVDPDLLIGTLKKELDGKVTWKDLTDRFEVMLKEQANVTREADEYSRHVQDDLIRDYPWYNYYKKLGHFASFKLTNLLLLHSYGSLNLENKDYEYLGCPVDFYRNPIYAAPKFSLNQSTEFLERRGEYSTFVGLNSAVGRNDFEKSVRWLVVLYNKLAH